MTYNAWKNFQKWVEPRWCKLPCQGLTLLFFKNKTKLYIIDGWTKNLYKLVAIAKAVSTTLLFWTKSKASHLFKILIYKCKALVRTSRIDWALMCRGRIYSMHTCNYDGAFKQNHLCWSFLEMKYIRFRDDH